MHSMIEPRASDEAFMAFLRESGYVNPRPLKDGIYVALHRFMFTYGIIVGEIGDHTGYLDRWCYCTLEAAQRAMDEWDGNGEPTGWHRHPASGRRVALTADEHPGVMVGQSYVWG